MKKTFKTIVILCAFTAPLSSFSQQKEPSVQSGSHLKKSVNSREKRAEFNLNTSALAASFNEGPDSSDFVLFQLKPSLTLNLYKGLKFKASGSLAVETGRAQTRFQNPNNQLINLEELTLSYQMDALESLNSVFKLEAGALSQKYFNAPNFLHQRAFPGIKASSHSSFGPLDLSLHAQYSIPNSVSLQSDRTQKEKTPTFSSIGLKGELEVYKSFKIESGAHYFNFQNLPSIVAFHSRRMGNSGVGETRPESYFSYAFEGLVQSHQFSWEYSKKLRQKILVSMVDNFRAPEDRQRSQYIGTSLDISFKDFNLSPSLAYFYAESDSVPALYTNAQLGRNNREGYKVQLKTEFKKQGFNLYLTYINAQTISPYPFQNDLDFIGISLEVLNVSL